MLKHDTLQFEIKNTQTREKLNTVHTKYQGGISAIGQSRWTCIHIVLFSKRVFGET